MRAAPAAAGGMRHDKGRKPPGRLRAAAVRYTGADRAKGCGSPAGHLAGHGALPHPGRGNTGGAAKQHPAAAAPGGTAAADKPCPGAVRGRGADPCRRRSAGAGAAPQAFGVQRCCCRGAAGDPAGKPSRRRKSVRFWCYELCQCRTQRPAQSQAAQSTAGRACPHTGAGAGHAAADRCRAGGGLCGTAPKPPATGGQQKGLLAAVRIAGRESRAVAAGYAAPRCLRSAAGRGHKLAALR